MYLITTILIALISATLGTTIGLKVNPPAEPIIVQRPVRQELTDDEINSIVKKVDSQLPSTEEILGAFQPAGGDTYRLKTSVGTSDTSMTLSSLTEPVSGIKITMTSLNSDIAYGTLDPQSSTRKEFISFTGITQNVDGTATITGVSRGLSFLYPFSASTTLAKSHPGQSIFILSDSPQLFNEYAKLRNDEYITGTWGFANAPTTTTECAETYELCSKDYIDNQVNQGAATSTEAVGGIVELATRTEAASTTPSTADKPLVLQAQHATSTPGSDITATGGTGETYIVMTEDDGKISQSFLDLTEDYTVSGEWRINSATTTTQDIASSSIHQLHTTNLTASSTILTKDLTIQKSCTNCAATTTFITADNINTEFSTAWKHSTTTPTSDIFSAVVTDPAGGDGDFRATTYVPKGVTGISAIKVIFKRTTTGNLRLQFDTGHIKLQAGSLPYTQQTDTTHTIASFNVATGDNAVDAISVPSDAYNGLTGISEGDIVSLNMLRGYTSNTYFAEMRVYGILFEWQ